jgi:hypothetical protein
MCPVSVTGVSYAYTPTYSFITLNTFTRVLNWGTLATATESGTYSLTVTGTFPSPSNQVISLIVPTTITSQCGSAVTISNLTDLASTYTIGTTPGT